MENGTRLRGAGGTPGGIGQFLLGAGMTIVGVYLFADRITVTTGYWHFWGNNSFGLTLIPMLIGIGLIFFNGRSIPGWLLAVGSLLLILVGIIANLQLYFSPTSLTGTIIILGLLAGGIGLVARSLSDKSGGGKIDG
ncbi:MAG: hypothetical protein L0220_01075 [Acidobacteria bacterium]|nr:hypothetical protein [Acidobacteriota bacterium]